MAALTAGSLTPIRLIADCDLRGRTSTKREVEKKENSRDVGYVVCNGGE